MKQLKIYWHQFCDTYTRSYRILLILSSLATTYTLLAIPSTVRLIQSTLASDPAYATVGIVTVALVTPLSVAALLLLWRVHRVGIYLKLWSYAAAICVAIAGFFTSDGAIERAVQQAIEQLRATPQAATLSDSAIRGLTELSFYGGLVLAIIVNGVFAWLWWRAWNQQQRWQSD